MSQAVRIEQKRIDAERAKTARLRAQREGAGVEPETAKPSLEPKRRTRAPPGEWTTEITQIIACLGDMFTLTEVYDHLEKVADKFPGVVNHEAFARHVLQRMRDHQPPLIYFHGRGKYTNLERERARRQAQ